MMSFARTKADEVEAEGVVDEFEESTVLVDDDDDVVVVVQRASADQSEKRRGFVPLQERK